MIRAFIHLIPGVIHCCCIARRGAGGGGGGLLYEKIGDGHQKIIIKPLMEINLGVSLALATKTEKARLQVAVQERSPR